ncbi:MAG TPA: hypothetical protein VFI02_19220 [Armatimonadota bacterium]|nr:hypothetical protein [Armatimonadota bacterium]
MSGHGEKLSRKQEQAIAALLSQPSIAEAAKSTGIAESTIRRWLKEGAFVEAYRIARRQVVAVALNSLGQACEAAVRTLREIMEDAKAPASSRVASAKAILETVHRACEQEDIVQRVAQLEAIINGA